MDWIKWPVLKRFPSAENRTKCFSARKFRMTAENKLFRNFDDFGTFSGIQWFFPQSRHVFYLCIKQYSGYWMDHYSTNIISISKTGATLDISLISLDGSFHWIILLTKFQSLPHCINFKYSSRLKKSDIYVVNNLKIKKWITN